MHYCCLLFTEKIPTHDEIDKIMKPFSDEEVYKDYEEDDDGNPIGEKPNYPAFMWDYWLIGGRYNGLLKLKVDFDENSQNNEKYKCLFCEDRNGVLFHSYLISEMQKDRPKWLYSEDKCYNAMGFIDGFLRVDGADIDDLLDFDKFECYCYVDLDGNGNSRNRWDGKDFIPNPNFDAQLAEQKLKCQGKFVTVLDIHD